MGQVNVYLAGKMDVAWTRDFASSVRILESGNRVIHFISPQLHTLKEPTQFTMWDTLGIDKCDVLLVYFEAGTLNPFGRCAEIGYAKAKGKKIIIVNERGTFDTEFTRSIGFPLSLADVVISTLEEAAELIYKLSTLEKNFL